MTWNYRLVKRKDGYFAVHEVYYNKRGEPWAMTENAVSLGPFETRKEINEMLIMVGHDVRRRGIFQEPDKWSESDEPGQVKPRRA